VKSANLALIITMVFGLTLVLYAQLPQQEQPGGPAPIDDNVIEDAHIPLYSPEDAALEASRLTEAVAAALQRGGVSSTPISRNNFVDEHIFGRMERDGIPRSPLSGDAEFLRRAYLDATGFLPNADEVRSFIGDGDPNKRDKVIDALVGTEEFVDQWAYNYGELFRTDDARFHLWTKEWIRVDRPLSEVFYDILTPTTKYMGGIPAGMYYDPTGYTNTRCIFVTDSDHLKGFNRLDWTDEVTSDLSRVFLGLTTDCISCHNGAGHTDEVNLWLTTKRRSDFHQQAAFFGQTRLVSSGGFQNGSPSIDGLGTGYNTGDDAPYWTPAEARFPRDGRSYEPAFLLTGETPQPGEDPRKALGRIAPQHIQFSRAAVNIIWKKLMVIGLVEPYDGFDLLRLDPNNPPPEPWTLQPTNPELLEALAEEFRDNGFRIRNVIKTIMKSNAYQLSTTFEGEWLEGYIPYHARRFARILTGPEAADIVAQATGTSATFDMQQYGEPRRYIKELTNPANMRIDLRTENRDVFAFMQAYYQSERALPPGDKSMASPIQAMMMMSSPVVTTRVDREGDTRVAALLKSGKSDDEIIEELVLTSLSRFPTAAEVEVAKRLIEEKGRSTAVETFQWVLLNNPEFLLNH
jgi:hypothetical protein